jgi:hypothetical protein
LARGFNTLLKFRRINLYATDYNVYKRLQEFQVLANVISFHKPLSIADLQPVHLDGEKCSHTCYFVLGFYNNAAFLEEGDWYVFFRPLNPELYWWCVSLSVGQ